MSTIASIGPGRFVLVVGPSGGGKDTIIAGAKEACLNNPNVVFPRRVVTRAVSAAEDHDSLDDATFERALNDGAFAFWWRAHGLKYGIPRCVNDDIRANRTVVCNVSRAVVASLRVRYPNVFVVLVTAPPEILATRLASRSRGTDGPLDQRLKRNDAFVELSTDHTINNTGAPNKAVQQLLNIINS